MENYLEIKNISKRYGSKLVLNNISASFKKNDFISILGPSGCGKSTLLKIIAGLESPSDGKLYVKGTDITNLQASKRKFGMVFQSYALFPNMTVNQNILFGLDSKKISKKEKDKKLNEMLKLVGLKDESDRYPYQISGGQQQRVALARALAIEPDILLLDEPLSALDAKVRVKLRKEIRKIHKEVGITTIIVTHDQDEALSLGDTVVLMRNAGIEQIGTPRNIYRSPDTPFAADFIGTITFFNENDLLKGVRPEDVIINPDHSNTCHYSGTVKSIEYRGSSFIIVISSDDPSFYMTDITVEVNEKTLKKHDININSNIKFSFDESKVISFGSCLSHNENLYKRSA